MPQYDYRCKDCEKTFSIERSMSESSDPVCISCGSTNAARIWNIHFQTSGNVQASKQSVIDMSAKTNNSSCCMGKSGGCH